jgi:hypothetical protein
MMSRPDFQFCDDLFEPRKKIPISVAKNPVSRLGERVFNRSLCSRCIEILRRCGQAKIPEQFGPQYGPTTHTYHRARPEKTASRDCPLCLVFQRTFTQEEKEHVVRREMDVTTTQMSTEYSIDAWTSGDTQNLAMMIKFFRYPLVDSSLDYIPHQLYLSDPAGTSHRFLYAIQGLPNVR